MHVCLDKYKWRNVMLEGFYVRQQPYFSAAALTWSQLISVNYIRYSV